MSEAEAHMPCSTPSLVTVITPCLHSCQCVVILDFSEKILQKMLHAVSYRSLATFQDREVHVASVSPSSRVPACAMLLLFSAVTCRIGVRDGFQKNNIRSKFRENLPTDSEVFFFLSCALHVVLGILVGSSLVGCPLCTADTEGSAFLGF
jgi:hypothetical protein